MARRQKARPQCLRPYSQGVRGEAESVDCGDEGRAGRTETAEGGGDDFSARARKGYEERPEESEKGEIK